VFMALVFDSSARPGGVAVARRLRRNSIIKGAITSKIKHAIKLKTSPARLAPLLQPSLAFCSQWRRTVYATIGCKLKQNANEDCNSCASLAGLVLCFVACFILLVIAP